MPALAEDAVLLSAFILWQKRPVMRDCWGYLEAGLLFLLRGETMAHEPNICLQQQDPTGLHALGHRQVAFNKTMEYVATSNLCSGIFLPGSSGFF